LLKNTVTVTHAGYFKNKEINLSIKYHSIPITHSSKYYIFPVSKEFKLRQDLNKILSSSNNLLTSIKSEDTSLLDANTQQKDSYHSLTLLTGDAHVGGICGSGTSVGGPGGTSGKSSPSPLPCCKFVSVIKV
jgi:hypothetical protein